VQVQYGPTRELGVRVAQQLGVEALQVKGDQITKRDVADAGLRVQAHDALVSLVGLGSDPGLGVLEPGAEVGPYRCFPFGQFQHGTGHVSSGSEAPTSGVGATRKGPILGGGKGRNVQRLSRPSASVPAPGDPSAADASDHRRSTG
jgi:hypothetical protein